MDALFRKVKKSPTVLQKGESGTIRHQKLPEGWGENKQPVAGDDGVVFYLKYLGSTLVEEIEDDESYGDGISAKAVQRIVAMAKSIGKKLKKIALRVSSRGFHMVDIITKEILFDLSIYRISFCTADKNHDKVFAYIARNTTNETMECHAFLCAKRKIAQAVTLTVWQAFTVAQERWCDQQNKKVTQPSVPHIQHSVETPSTPVTTSLSPFSDSFTDYDYSKTSLITGVSCCQQTSVDTSDDENLEDSFSKLAETRGRVRLPSFSTDLRQEDVDEGVQQYMDGKRCFEEFSRQKSMEDLLNL
ncbi:low density lipoprotein receptor adapter protein 1-like isoform X2 [Pomacea canaliculata]|uniref:low density lipoprotein receptor adapter protein 1-like isoform X2 n=1 Tax=Pomacea canaliculata TaxID=400727 RepID=UPI000D725A5D|nr:low density lipoprotein receptor adapter protein 1-like isoform X2 [Pomacea canaliculata]